jgi:hypothetical protein
MKKWHKFSLIGLFVVSFMVSIVINMPAWLMGSIIHHYSQNRLDVINERGSFWNGRALLIGEDASGKSAIPLMMVNWKIKLGVSKLININLSSSNQTIANLDLTKSGLQLSKVNLSLSLDQLTPFLGNLNSLNLSGNVHVTADKISAGSKMQGTVLVKLDDVGSGMSPVNPIGSYNVNFDLSSMGITISSNPNSVIDVSGSGNVKNLVLNSKVQPDKKEKLLQFMTMTGIPQADGSYQMKAF